MSENDRSNPVLVTGASGFIAMHCIIQLLERGYRVRGTLRSMGREPAVRATLAEHVEADGRLEFVGADLLRDEGWHRAAAGCESVLHVASPFPPEEPKDEAEVVRPAVDGTLRVLRAAAGAGVRRVVLTSSIAAIAYGHASTDRTFTEADWTDLGGKVRAYEKSKTLAERAAWDFAGKAENQGRIELAVINPGLVMGPLLDTQQRTSDILIRRLMRREVPGLAPIRYAVVDVRDVAAAHLAAMTVPEAAGQRFLCAAGVCSMRDVALILQRHFGNRRYRIPTREFPAFLIHLVALRDPTTRMVLDDLNRPLAISNEHIKRVLGWQPRPPEEAIVSMAESMIRLGLVGRPS